VGDCLDPQEVIQNRLLPNQPQKWVQ